MNTRVTSLIFTLVTISLSAQTFGEALSINDAESAGFEKDQQQLYQMVGAENGWSGFWVDERVELYEFPNSVSVNAEFFQSATEEGNISGWVDSCTVHNMFMLSRGNNACAQLELLAE